MRRVSVFFVVLAALTVSVFASEIKVLLYLGKGPMDFNGEYYRSERFRLRLNNASMHDGEIYLNGMGTGKSMLRLTPENGVTEFAGKTYRGDLIILTDYFRIMVINAVDMESYLKGVLPREISASWPEEAIKAQAVAARTFAYRMITDNGVKVYHLDATHMSQVYGGMSAEDDRTSDAVDATRNTVLTYKGDAIKAFYHSSSGGVTSRPSDVWATDDGDYPYLKSFKDPYSNHSPNQQWSYTVTIGRIMELFGLEGLKKIRVSYSGSGRAVSVEFVLPGGHVKRVSGNEFRMRLGSSLVKSTLFKAVLGDGVLTLNGRGWGHGVGMSQWGAYNMALKGYSYKDILAFYYRGTELSRVRGR